MEILVDKWVIINDENGERYVIGRITVVHKQLLCVIVAPAAGPPYTVLEHMDEMLDGRMRIFDSELELRQWLEWANSPSSEHDNVVSIQ